MSVHDDNKSRKWLSPWVALLLAIPAGCLSRPTASHVQRMPPPPPEVRPAPRPSGAPLDPVLRDSARQLLLSCGDLSDPFLRSNSLEALGDTAPDIATEPVLRGLGDPDPSVRFSAAIVAGQLRLPTAYRLLLGMLHDQDLRVQAAVRFGLHRLNDTRFSHDLEQLATNFDPAVRASTAMVLGLLEEPSGIVVLLPMQKDRVPAVRLQADEALWRLHDERGRDALIALTVSGYPDDQIVALQALAAPKDERVMGHLHGALTSDYKEVSLAAARAMGSLGSDLGWNVAVPAAKSSDPRQRALAALAMGAIGRSDLQGILGNLLKDSDPGVRITAATAILQLRSPG